MNNYIGVVTDRNYRRLLNKAPHPVLLMIAGTDCSECPTEERAKELSGKHANVVFGWVPWQSSTNLQAKYEVESHPEILLLQNLELLAADQGVMTNEMIRDFIERHVGKPDPVSIPG